MPPELFTRENIHTLSFPQTADGDYARRYLIPLMTDPQKYIHNVNNTQLMAVKVGEMVIPITVTDFHPQNTYTVSPYSHYVSYGGLEEVKHLNNPLAEAVVKAIMKPIAGYFRYAELDKVVFVNNYLVSVSKQRPAIGVERSAYPLVSRSGGRLPLSRSEKESACVPNAGRAWL
jgi:hypothetical protein